MTIWRATGEGAGDRSAQDVGGRGAWPPPAPAAPADGRGLWSRLTGWMHRHSAEPAPPPSPPLSLAYAPAWPWGRLRRGDAETPAVPDETGVARCVATLLLSLGPTPGDLAASLERSGVRARPDEPGCAPLARFLGAVVGADPEIASVTLGEGTVIVEPKAWWRQAVAVPLPKTVAGFVTAFEAGCYPSLLHQPPPPPVTEGDAAPDARAEHGGPAETA